MFRTRFCCSKPTTIARDTHKTYTVGYNLPPMYK